MGVNLTFLSMGTLPLLIRRLFSLITSLFNRVTQVEDSGALINRIVNCVLYSMPFPDNPEEI